MISVNLLDDAHESLAARYIDAFPSGVEVNVVRIGHARYAGDRGTSFGIEHNQLCRLSGHHEKSVIGLVERHRIVGLAWFQRPIRYSVGLTIDQDNFPLGIDVGVANGPGTPVLKRYEVCQHHRERHPYDTAYDTL